MKEIRKALKLRFVMDSFRFKCITISKTEIQRGAFIKAVNKNGNTELFIYGKKTYTDNMNFLEVTGFYKSTSKNYLIVKNTDVLNRFSGIRESFSKLSAALLMMDITYKTKIGMELLLKGLIMLEKQTHQSTLIWFFSSFLLQNGIFDKNKYSPQELSVIKFILKSYNASKLKLSDYNFTVLSRKLLNDIENYADIKFAAAKV